VYWDNNSPLMGSNWKTDWQKDGLAKRWAAERWRDALWAEFPIPCYRCSAGHFSASLPDLSAAVFFCVSSR
jgi:hypothetical protein